jgi:hypothetical protein
MNDKDQPPFNPIPLPPEFNLEAHQQTAQQKSENPGAEQTKQTSGAKTRRPSRKPTVAQPDVTCPVLSKWERIKGEFAEKIAQIDPETLKSVLLACGIAAGVVAAVLLLVKMVPVAVAVLALLGIGLIIAIWDRLRYFPRPF